MEPWTLHLRVGGRKWAWHTNKVVAVGGALILQAAWYTSIAGLALMIGSVPALMVEPDLIADPRPSQPDN